MQNLAKGHSLPNKPVYWLIWVLDEKTRKPYHSRLTYSKYLTPYEASKECYGISPTRNLLFFNMTSRVVEMRKMLIKINKLWSSPSSIYMDETLIESLDSHGAP